MAGWNDEGLEEDMRHNRQDRFFKKMKRLMNSRVTPAYTKVVSQCNKQRRNCHDGEGIFKKH